MAFLIIRISHDYSTQFPAIAYASKTEEATMKTIITAIIITAAILGCDDPYKSTIKAITTPSGAEIYLNMPVTEIIQALGAPHRDRPYNNQVTNRFWVYYLPGGPNHQDDYYVLGLYLTSPGIVKEIFSADYEAKVNCEVYHEYVKRLNDAALAKIGGM
jgi:outer membrane protein assembly factor BamE (lipoprotein component of BamABCDE complex)